MSLDTFTIWDTRLEGQARCVEAGYSGRLTLEEKVLRLVRDLEL